MTNFGLTIILSLFISSTFFSQQLILNEVSQGVGSSEYVEFVVIGSASCSTPVPCIDLRKVIIDDNNGYFAPGSGTGIAAGAVRFADNTFWSCVPQGTYIVIYNESSPNSNLPADDISLTDGNCKLIIPASSNLLEMTTVNSPSTTTNLYPPDISWAVGGSWAPLAMSNSNDSFQIPNLAINGTPLHAVSWGNNSANTIIYFSGSANLKVFSFVNAVSNDWYDQLNWVAGDVGVNETPGYANCTANDNWLATMNPQCGVAIPIVLSELVNDVSCFGLCDGSVTVSTSNGTAPYTYLWQNGETTQTITNLCEGVYSVVVTDFGGCEQTTDITVNQGVISGDASVSAAGPFTINSSSTQLVSVTSGGTWSSDCSSCLTSTGVFSPQISGAGTFEICHQTGSGTCSNTACINIVVTNNCVPQVVDSSAFICPEDSILIFNQWESQGVFNSIFTDSQGCDSSVTIRLNTFATNSILENELICLTDSISVFGTWVSEAGTYTILEDDIHGCSIQHTVIVLEEDCFVEPFVVYIPNSFTPNGDGTNDIFKIEILGGKVKSGFIMNRWGNEIATFNENKLSWDGKYSKGEIAQDGTYTYVVNCISFEDIRLVKTGSVTLFR